MKITNTEQFLKCIGDNGKVKEPITLAEGCTFWDLINLTSLEGVILAEGCTFLDLTSLTSLEGVTLAEGCTFLGLTSLTSFEGVTLANGCSFWDLTSLTSLEGVTLAEGCEFGGLSEDISLSANPSDEEMKIISQIQIENLKMKFWHCGTSHCLAGWAQIISGRDIDDGKALSDGRELLPSLSHLFFAPDKPVKKLLLELQDKSNALASA